MSIIKVNTIQHANGTTALSFAANGQVTLANTPLQLTGGQIVFPSTPIPSADANTLDDYEEGTWTPSMTSQGGTLTAVNNGIGYYTKIGNAVTITCRPIITTNGSGTTALLIAGLPFAASPPSHLAGASREDAVTGIGFCVSSFTSTSLYLQKYDATYLGANGYAFPICITYIV